MRPNEGVVVNIAAMAAVLFSEAQERTSRRPSSPIRSGSGRWAGAHLKGSPGSSAARRIPPGACPFPCSRSTRRTARYSTASSGPAPNNPLGKHAFYLDWPSYLIHGTNKPAGVGLRSSHGLHPAVSRGHCPAVRNGAHRYSGAGGQPTLRLRVERRAASTCRRSTFRGRPARLERRAKEASQQVTGRDAAEAAEESQ